jgi:hypothetical protein
MEKVKKLHASEKLEDLAPAVEALERVASKDEKFAPARYWLGRMAEESGDLRQAARRYDEALERLPGFAEALAARAYLHLLSGQWKEARALVDRALALAPDLPEGHTLRARIFLEDGDAAAAVQAAGTARKLAPLDLDLQARAQMVRNVTRGPSWARPHEHASAHYVVRSDLSVDRCRAYADHLEAMRSVYEEATGLAAAPGKRAQVVIFNVPEGYYSYIDFTSGDRMENTLGLFSPWYGQMVLFEDAEQAETLKVLGHEGFHQFLAGALPNGAPIWFNEGMAEYVGATRVEAGRVVQTGGLQEGRLSNLKAAMKYGWRARPFRDIMRESQAEFYGADAPFKYAQAWSMIHFFMHGEGGRHREALKAYIERLKAGDTAAEAFEAAFGAKDLDAMDAAWRKAFDLPAASAIAAAPAAAPAGTPRPAAPAKDPAKEKELEERIDRLAGELSKGESAKLDAINELSKIRHSKVRSLLAKKLTTDSIPVRMAAASALAMQRHPESAKALGAALKGSKSNPKFLSHLVGCLGELDMCACIAPLVEAVGFGLVEPAVQALEAIQKIGCPEAAEKLVPLAERLLSEERKLKANGQSTEGILAMFRPLAAALQRFGQGSTKGIPVLYFCEETGKVFSNEGGKGCPVAPDVPNHDDTFLKHGQ